MDILECAAGGEGRGPRLEFKRVLPRDERAARTLCAFANTRGGLLLVGITDRGRVHGVHRPDAVTAGSRAISRRRASIPRSRSATQVVDVSGPRVVACSVPFSSSRPHAVLLGDGEREVFVRVGSSNRSRRVRRSGALAEGSPRPRKDPLEAGSSPG